MHTEIFNLFASKVYSSKCFASLEHVQIHVRINIHIHIRVNIHIHISAQFLLEHGHHDTDSIMRGKAAVAFHNGNFKELYSIMEGRWVGNTIFANTFNMLATK